MTSAQPAGGADDLFEAIAARLEPAQREHFYQRMLYFRQLRPDDELLRIAEAMGFLALLIRDVPHAVAVEREQLAGFLTTALGSLQATVQSGQAYQQQLERRLAALPAEIADGISAPGIAATITESLRQQFVRSGLPVTAEALAVATKELKQTTADIQRSTGQLAACTRVTEDARRAIDEVRTSLSHASDDAKQAVTDLARTFRREYHWSVATLCAAALMLGVLLGYGLQVWKSSGPDLASPPPTSQARSPVATPSQSEAKKRPLGRMSRLVP